MKKIIYFFLKNTFGKKKYFRLYEILRNISFQGLNYRNTDMATNGELYLMTQLQKYFNAKPIIFDIGANTGQYTKTINEAFCGNCCIYSFEPYSKAYKQLTETVNGILSINTFPIGFGDIQQTIEFYSDPVYSELGGVFKRDFSKHNIYMDDKEFVKLDTLDNFCLENKIDRIDFLKIDVEGFEVNILKGAKKLLNGNKIGIIQFEYGSGNYLSKTYLYDFFQLLSSNFKIYKLMTDGLQEIIDYHSDYEIHTLSNYVAVNNNHLNFSVNL